MGGTKEVRPSGSFSVPNLNSNGGVSVSGKARKILLGDRNGVMTADVSLFPGQRHRLYHPERRCPPPYCGCL